MGTSKEYFHSSCIIEFFIFVGCFFTILMFILRVINKIGDKSIKKMTKETNVDMQEAKFNDQEGKKPDEIDQQAQIRFYFFFFCQLFIYFDFFLFFFLDDVNLGMEDKTSANRTNVANEVLLILKFYIF